MHQETREAVMKNEMIAKEFSELIKKMYKNAICRYENGTFIFSATSKKTLRSILVDFALVSKMIRRKISFQNARTEKNRYVIDAVFGEFYS